MRVIVCGSRDFDAAYMMCGYLDDVCEGLCGLKDAELVVVHGAARGADSLAEDWAKLERGYRYPNPVKVTSEPHPADWDRHGKRAGIMRNHEMAELGASLCLAFWDGQSPGTRHMIETAVRRGIHTRIVPWRKP